MMMYMIIVNSLLFILLKHPVSMGMLLLIQTINVCLITGMMTLNFWFSYLLFLIMIGGMLILFAYMTSVASNEKFKFSFKTLLFTITMLLTTMMFFMLIDPFFSNIDNLMNNSMKINQNFKLSLNKFINFPSNMIMYTMIIYLLITLIAVVKITDFKSGPLRQMN